MLSLNRHEISAVIKERFASVTYTFGFENLNANGSNELKFEITIDSDAFVSNFTADIDGELFCAQIKEKKKAKKEYVEAKEKNENAILISQPYDGIPNVFKIQTNIDSKSKILLKLNIQQYITKTFNFNQLSIQILKSFSLCSLDYDYIAFKSVIEDESGIFDIKIPSNIHDLTIDTANKHKISMKGQIKSIDNINEIILKYKIFGEQNDSTVIYDKESGSFCHLISDLITNNIRNEGNSDELELKQHNNILIPRRVVFVIDRSGSMSGTKWDKTISATIVALKQLRKTYDRYCIILFDHSIQVSSDTMIIANHDNITESISYLEDANVGGSTNINAALLKAIHLIKNDIKHENNAVNEENFNFYMNQILFITDGDPNDGESDPNQIILNVKNANILNADKYCSKISIFCLGVGYDDNDGSWVNNLNHSFLRTLSLNNNGIYHRVKQSSADTFIGQVYDVLSKPILSNIRIVYENKNIYNLTQTAFDTLYAGNDLVVSGQIYTKNEEKEGNGDKDTLYLNAMIFGVTATVITNRKNNTLITKPIHFKKQIKININEMNNKTNNNIERIWAYLKLQQFAKNKVMNGSNCNDNDISALKLSMRMKFVTPWTSMIVVKEKSPAINTEQYQHNKPNESLHKELNVSLRKEMRRKSMQCLSQQIGAKEHLSDEDIEEMEDITYTKQKHRRDCSAPVVDLGFEDTDVLLHFEQLKVKDLENELESKLNEMKKMEQKIRMVETENNDIKQEMEQIIESKAAITMNCSNEIMRLTMILNTMLNIGQFKDTVQLLINDSHKINWKQWTYFDVVKWIIALKNGEYKQYEKVMLNAIKIGNMMNQSVNLKNFTKNDLKSLGITYESHRHHIWLEIQKLIY